MQSQVQKLEDVVQKVKDSNGRSGRGRKVCKFYNEIDAILDSRPATRPPVVIESLNDGEKSSSDSRAMKIARMYR